MIRVIIESPYAGDIERNTLYARRCLKDSLNRGESPFASHLLYTQPGVLDDSIPTERALGIHAGFSWRDAAEIVAFYVDYGWSPGMIAARDALEQEEADFTIRRIGPNPDTVQS